MAVTTILLGIGAALLALTVHELGHLVAGLAVGFRFSLFAIGPLLVERAPSGRIRIARNRVPSLFGGAAGTLPVGAGGLRWRFAVVTAGGPAASLLLALAAAAALAWLAPPHGALRTSLSWVRLLSAALFVGTAIPIPNGPFVTDGLRFLRILDRGARGDRESSLLTLAALEQGGRRPREWDASLLDRGLNLRDGSIFECQMHLYAYMHALDSGRPEAAGQSLDSALSLRVPDFLLAPCRLEAAFFEAAHRADPVRARELLGAVRPGTFGALEADRLRAVAAIAVAEGDVSAARAMIAEALAKSPAWAAGPRAWLAELLPAADPAPHR